MPRRTYTEAPNAASADDAIRREVREANAEGRAVELSDDQLRHLGHRKRNPLKVIREFCIRCMGGSPSEVKCCTSPGCPLFVYRFGRDPYSNRKGRPDFGKNLPDRQRVFEQRGENAAETGGDTAEPDNAAGGAS